MTSLEININVNHAMTQARELRTIASNLDSASTKLMNSHANLEAAWMGKNANTFNSRISDERSKLERVTQSILEVADAIERTARAYEAAENAKIAASGYSAGGGGYSAGGGGGGYSGGGGGGSR